MVRNVLMGLKGKPVRVALMSTIGVPTARSLMTGRGVEKGWRGRVGWTTPSCGQDGSTTTPNQHRPIMLQGEHG